MQRSDIDIYRVHIFVPSIEDPDPLRRLTEMMRRYQPSAFALFRTEALVTCAKQAAAVRGLLFQEIMFMNTLVLQGKVARVPGVFGLHGTERSHSPITQRDPMMSFLAARPVFSSTIAAIATRSRNSSSSAVSGRLTASLSCNCSISFMARGSDTISMSEDINDAVQGLLDGDAAVLVEESDWPGPRPIGPRDRVDRRAMSRHIWRDAVLNAEPREEITIGDHDVEEVNKALDILFAGPGPVVPF